MRIKLLLIVCLFSISSVAAESPFLGLTDVKGNAIQEIKSNKLLVYYWATWCPTCRDKLENTLPQWTQNNKQFDLITINTDRDPQRAARFLEKKDLSLPMYVDSNHQLTQLLQAVSVPHWAVFEKIGDQWKVVNTEGGFDEEKVKKALGI